jgi:hypothetical protein
VTGSANANIASKHVGENFVEDHPFPRGVNTEDTESNAHKQDGIGRRMRPANSSIQFSVLEVLWYGF